jgi:hypothetical protein
MAGKPFRIGTLGVQANIDPRTLGRGDRAALDARRLAHQLHLLRQGLRRFTLIEVNEVGRIHDGHHGVRAAIELNMAVDVNVVAGDEPPAGPPLMERILVS